MKTIKRKEQDSYLISYSTIDVVSSFGHEIKNLFLMHEPKSTLLTVLFPGVNNTCESPLLYYGREAALQAGSDVLGIEYGYRRAGREFSSEMYAPSLKETMEAIRRCGLEKYRRVSFISKSFGTLIAGEITKQFTSSDILNFFLTPVPSTIPYITKAECTVVCGAADPYFSQKDVDKIAGNPHMKLVIVPGADHSLAIENDYRASLQVLMQVCETYDAFFHIVRTE